LQLFITEVLVSVMLRGDSYDRSFREFSLDMR
jgi:hypothetical protein